LLQVLFEDMCSDALAVRPASFKDPRRRGVVAALDNESSVMRGALSHVILLHYRLSFATGCTLGSVMRSCNRFS
jgi:hypothetical protein